MRQLFKYTSAPLRILENGYIRATQLSALNDPFEATYCKDGIIELASHFDDLGSDEAIEHIENAKHKVGVICLTEAKDNLLMWSHYANEHRGGLVGIFVDSPNGAIFEDLRMLDYFSTSCFGEKYELFNGRCLPVQYRKQPRYRVDKFDFDYSNISVEGADRLLFEIFQQKSDEWIYEKEHRITLRLEQADMARIVDLEKIGNSKFVSSIKSSDAYSEESKDGETISVIKLDEMDDALRTACAMSLAELATNPLNLYFFKLSQSAISSVVLGHSANRSLIEPIPRYFTNIGMSDIYKATLDNDHYTVKVS